MCVTLSANEMLNLEMAAIGCVSSPLSRWPVLQSALKKCGYDVTDNLTAREVRVYAMTELNRRSVCHCKRELDGQSD